MLCLSEWGVGDELGKRGMRIVGVLFGFWWSLAFLSFPWEYRLSGFRGWGI